VVVSAVLLLVFGFIGFAIATPMIAREQSLTRKAYDAEKKRAEEAEQRFQLARRSADEMIRLAEEELADNPAMQNFRRRLLETALVYYQEFLDLRREDADAQAELAVTRDRVKKILDDLAVLQGFWHPSLLKDRTVLDDLKLSPEQRTQITELLGRMDQQRQESFREFHRLSSEERQKRFLELVRSNDAALAAILTPEEVRRLRQIALQCQGPMAFQEPEVASALKLTGSQRKQIRTIDTNFFLEKPPFEGFGGPGGAAWKALEERRKSALKQIVAILTAEQSHRWQEMTGEPFANAGRIFLPVGPFRFGFGPPPPPGFGPPPPRDPLRPKG
jgi:hypothetical protein